MAISVKTILESALDQSASVYKILNDISTQFDGKKSVFTLKIDQDSSLVPTIVDSKDVQVSLNGRLLAPYVKELTYPWIRDYDSYKGFRVVNNSLIIYNAPSIEDQAVITIVNTSAAAQTKRYPYSATTIALGD